MTASLRSPVPGELSLLELLEQLDDPNDDNNPNGFVNPVGANGDEVGPLRGVGLGEWERALLRFASEHHLAGRYTERVEQQLGCSATRYLQALTAMLDRPEALAAAPELIGRLRALRDRRQRLRALGRGEGGVGVEAASPVVKAR